MSDSEIRGLLGRGPALSSGPGPRRAWLANCAGLADAGIMRESGTNNKFRAIARFP